MFQELLLEDDSCVHTTRFTLTFCGAFSCGQSGFVASPPRSELWRTCKLACNVGGGRGRSLAAIEFRQFLCGAQLKSTKRAEDGRASAKHAQRMPSYPWILTLKEVRPS